MTLAPGDRIVANVTTANIGASVFGSESNLWRLVYYHFLVVEYQLLVL
jgi:hypothetical protein